MNYINASCIIGGNRIIRDGKVIFELARTGATPDFLASDGATPGLATAPAALPDFLAATYRYFDLQYPKFYKMDTLSKLGWLAAELLLRGFPKQPYASGAVQQHAPDAPGHYAPESVGLVLSNANASLDTDVRYWDTVKDMPSPAVFVYTLPNIVAGEICIRHQWKGENAFFVSPAFDIPLTHWYTADLLDNGRLEACVCGWVEVSEDSSCAAVFLVEKQARPGALAFMEESLEALFQINSWQK